MLEAMVEQERWNSEVYIRLADTMRAFRFSQTRLPRFVAQTIRLGKNQYFFFDLIPTSVAAHMYPAAMPGSKVWLTLDAF